MAPIAPEILTSLRSIDPSATFTLSGSHRVTSSQNAVYFAKMCRTLNERDQFFGESESLKAMNDAAPGICPKVIRFDELEIPNSGGAVMISEYKDMGGLNSQVAQILAKRLALEMHDPERSKQATTKEDGTRQWGFHVPTYCGPTRIENGWYDTWEEAYGAMIGGLVDKLEGTSSEVVKLGRELQSKVIPYLLSPSRLRDIEPVTLHGDLWSGNVGADSSGEPVIFDPASCYGHNEFDLALSRMFGGFPSSFISTYHSYRSKSEPESEYEDRQTLYEVFHYLNHAVIFGGSGYANQAATRMRKLISKARA